MKANRILAAGAAMLALGAYPLSALAADSSTVVDVSPVVGQIVHLVGAVVALIAVPIFWNIWKWVAAKAHLGSLKIDDQYRAVINQELMKAIGAGFAKVDGVIAGKSMSVDVKSKVIASAAEQAMKAIPDALNYFGLNDPKTLADMIEARLGLLNAGAAPVLGPAGQA